MATFFGEILPLSSRAVDDEEDDENCDLNFTEPVLQWSNSITKELETAGEKRISCDNLVVALGEEANAFTDVYVKTYEYELIGGIFTGVDDKDPSTLLQNAPSDRTCLIYRCCSNPKIIICQCNTKVSPEQTFQWSKLLCDNINLDAAYIAVLATCSTGSYTSHIPPSDLDTPFLRALKTDKFAATPVCKILEQPNMLTDMAAQLMTFFQVHNYKAVIYVVYKEARYAEISTVKAFIPILDVTPIRDIAEPIKNAEDKLRDIVDKRQDHDMMYL